MASHVKYCKHMCNAPTNPRGVCPPRCKDLCPPDCMEEIFHYPPPPPPLSPPPPPPPPKQSLPPPPLQHKGISISIGLAVTLVVLATFLFIGALYWFYRVYRRDGGVQHEEVGIQLEAPVVEPEEAAVVEPAPEADPFEGNFIWNIVNIGLPDGAINSIPTVRYPSSSGINTHCCLCLGTFEEGETLRLLPCRHFFHFDCIDPWLRTHATCPLCRFEITE